MFYLFLFFIGISIGSFLNVLIDRLPNEQSITGRSHCDYCRHQLAWHDLIPIISFFLLRGRCRYCRKKISFQYPLVEILTGAMFVLIFHFHSPIGGSILNYTQLVAYLGIIACLIVIFFSDLKYRIIPDSIQISLFVFSAMLNISRLVGQIKDSLGAGLIVMVPILLLFFITRGRGMGFGDVKLAFNIGFLLGWQGGLIALYFAFISGAVIGLILIFLGKKRLKSKIAFGPFLVLGILIMLFWGGRIFAVIQRIYGF